MKKTREDFRKKGKCKLGHCSSISNSAWCDLNSIGTFRKLPDMCPNTECNCQKQIRFTPRQFELEGNGFKGNLKKVFKGTGRA